MLAQYSTLFLNQAYNFRVCHFGATCNLFVRKRLFEEVGHPVTRLADGAWFESWFASAAPEALICLINPGISSSLR